MVLYGICGECDPTTPIIIHRSMKESSVCMHMHMLMLMAIIYPS